MQPVNGFMSIDGIFFSSEEACRFYEDNLARQNTLASRCELVVNAFKSGQLNTEEGRKTSLLPKDLVDFLGTISIDGFEDIWNEYLIYLFVAEDGPVSEKFRSTLLLHKTLFERSRHEMDYMELFLVKAEIAYRLLAFVLDKPL